MGTAVPLHQLVALNPNYFQTILPQNVIDSFGHLVCCELTLAEADKIARLKLVGFVSRCFDNHKTEFPEILNRTYLPDIVATK